MIRYLRCGAGLKATICNNYELFLKQKTRKSKIFGFFWWCHLELNQGHTDFQSVALPTELWHLLNWVANVNKNFSSGNIFFKKINLTNTKF